jgi:hypothetical protein
LPYDLTLNPNGRGDIAKKIKVKYTKLRVFELWEEIAKVKEIHELSEVSFYFFNDL